MELLKWGATKEQCGLALEYPDLLPARVTAQEKNQYRLITKEGECAAKVSGKFRYDVNLVSEYPAVGDFVLVEYHSKEDTTVIKKVLPRKSVFIRKAAGTNGIEQVVAANIDTVFLCMALNKDFNVRRLERYLSIAWDSGALPVVLLTKADLCKELSRRRAEVERIAAGVSILETSALTGTGISQITRYIQSGNTVAFMGSSGVGKSTLVNQLLGEKRIATNTLRDDDKGRHTTTHRELYFLPGGGMVIDTPGMRELGMWNAKEGIDRTFSDVEELAVKCCFRNCSHTSEPGCAVQRALQEGALSKERFLAFQKLQSENAYTENSASYLSEKRKKFKEIARYNKKNQRK